MTSHSLSYAKANSFSPPIFPSKAASFARSSVDFLGYNCLIPRNLKFSGRELRNFAAIRASDSQQTPASNASPRWLLEPVGDGDSRHIGYKIARPGAFEIASNVVTIGRVPDKADVVIPVPTVSGLHARIEKTEGNLLITDLDSTNGTFINEKRLLPGVVSPASPGNLITFGDTNLAIFRVFKLEKEELSSEQEESELEPKA
ncbi:SMAD/FHA domain-containing protein [Perilla frutescens var. hirtella]|uniref:SMAD/FHA domain-containing protein n=1 Tax=Perilla frutescens var. hirtella TaxID=608512 RepID=A0AAD4JE22_PERFH|nr:SMAD/FHA domain-containing protein [Perilla frutescens var. hirtella]